MRKDNFTNWKEKCTGCFSCYQVCPVHAIEKKKQYDGFFYPVINENACISCGFCLQVCHINKNKEQKTTHNIYSAQAQDDAVRNRGSSGGIFELLSKKIMGTGGVVYGAVFDHELRQVYHTSTDMTQLVNILRSKYVQSDTKETFKEVGHALLNDRAVLYCGTPCQIYGLISYLKAKKIRGSLYTVDFFCHGVPSPEYFKYMISDIEKQNQQQVVDFTFREKDNGWREQTLKAYLKDGGIWQKSSLDHYYYYYFLNNYTLRDSCYYCDLYNRHVADITLADNWQEEKGDDKGTSLVLCNTDLGVKLFNAIRSQCEIEALTAEFNYELYSHVSYNHKYKQKWLNKLKKIGFEGVSNAYFKKLKKKDEIEKLLCHIAVILKKKLRRV